MIAWLVFFLVPAFFVLVAVFFVVMFNRLRARVLAIQALAQRIGFTFSSSDVEHIVALPLPAFSRGEARRVELVISGTHNGVPLRIFDYSYSGAGSDRSRYEFTCALATIDAACPLLVLGHENVLTRLGDDLGLDDVQLEYDAFNRRFRVKCADQKFAFSLLDGGMMEWLLDSGDFESVEVCGPWVLLVRPVVRDAGRWLDLGTFLEAFVRHIPRTVYSTYPPR
jgi:hypothetical protein